MARRLSLVGGYVAAAVALVVFWWLQRRGLLAATPYWLLMVFLAGSCIGDAAGRLTQQRWPQSVRADRVRLATGAATTALVLYATGWGSFLTIGFAVGATQVLSASNQPDWRWAYGLSVAAVVTGEIAVQLEFAPTLIEVRLAHAVALVGVLCLAVVLWILGEALDAAETNQRLAREREDELLRQATHDPLTGLPNRALFNDRLEQALLRRTRTGGYVAVLIVDLDGFKNVNDSLGHLVGDALLVAVATRFRDQLREFDTIARLGGDEFAIVFDDLDAPSQAGRIAQRVLDGLTEPLQLADRTVAIGASVGITLTDRADADPHLLLSHADIAMYHAKRAGKACYRVFQPAMHSTAVERMNLEQELRAGIGLGQLSAEYQPLVDLRTGDVCSFEALLRWHHPTRGPVPPSTFIEVAEEAGLIGELGRGVLREACEQAGGWARGFPRRRPGISVNVSRLQLEDPKFMDQMSDALDRAELDASSLVLEVTESVLARDSTRIIAVLDEVRRAGVRVSIDDFGTGYSSLAALAELPIDILKIDKRFIDRLTVDPEREGVVVAILQLARTLGLDTVAEGVEHPEQRAALAKLGCTHIQGYLVARPMPAHQVHDFLVRHQGRPLGLPGASQHNAVEELTTLT